MTEQTPRPAAADDQSPSDPRRAFGHFLRAARENIGMSQKEVADSLDVSQAMLSRAEAGRRLPSDQKLFQLADLLGIDPATMEERRTLVDRQARLLAVNKATGQPRARQAGRADPTDLRLRGTQDVEAESRAVAIRLFAAQLQNAMLTAARGQSAAANRMELIALIVTELRTLTAPQLAVVRAYVDGVKASVALRRPDGPTTLADTRMGPDETTTPVALARELDIAPSEVIRHAAELTGVVITPTTALNVELADHVREAHRGHS